MKAPGSFSSWPWALLCLVASAKSPVRRVDWDCSFTLSVAGFNGLVSQLPDGRVSVGGTEPEATFRIDASTFAIVGVNGASCIIAGSSANRTPSHKTKISTLTAYWRAF